MSTSFPTSILSRTPSLVEVGIQPLLCQILPFLHAVAGVMQWNETWGIAAVNMGVCGHGGCCLFSWACHMFPHSAAEEHLVPTGLTRLLGHSGRLERLHGDKEISASLEEQPGPFSAAMLAHHGQSFNCSSYFTHALRMVYIIWLSSSIPICRSSAWGTEDHQHEGPQFVWHGKHWT